MALFLLPTRFRARQCPQLAKLPLYPVIVRRCRPQPPQFVSLGFNQVPGACLPLTRSRIKLLTHDGKVFVRLRGHDKMPRTGGAETVKFYFLTALEAGRSRSWQSSASGEDPLSGLFTKLPHSFPR